MTVYVDNARLPLGRMKMCHMVADALPELHRLAVRLGVRKHFQANASFPHYDICLSKRAQAIRLGAVEVDRKTLVEVMRRYRKRVAGGEA